jgi:hypothetical protein
MKNPPFYMPSASLMMLATLTRGQDIPSITPFSPSSGQLNTAVTLTEINFGASVETNIVHFGVTRASSEHSSDIFIAPYRPTEKGKSNHDNDRYFDSGRNRCNTSRISFDGWTIEICLYNYKPNCYEKSHVRDGHHIADLHSPAFRIICLRVVLQKKLHS